MTCCVHRHYEARRVLEIERTSRIMSVIERGAIVTLQGDGVTITGKKPECPTPAACPEMGYLTEPEPKPVPKSVLKPSA